MRYPSTAFCGIATLDAIRAASGDLVSTSGQELIKAETQSVVTQHLGIQAVSPAGPAPMMIAVLYFTLGPDPFLLNNQSIAMIRHK